MQQTERPSNFRLSVFALFATCLFAASSSACSTNVGIDGAPDGSADRDARVGTGPYDECGNGMDDDGDGLIDEDCFCGQGETQDCFSGMYPARGVGACGDGVQTCDAVGSMEFGRWGACTMDALPASETCDGIDNDCDGAVDEGCPCAAGETRGCGLEFVTEPCTGGTQTCDVDGSWSACEGAIGPSAEACGSGDGDGIDNDCDGMVDEGCSCVSEPEVCDDGIDNDCDGDIDEAACGMTLPLPDAGPDAAMDAGVDSATPGDSGPADSGTPVPDACVPETERCGDGVDNDCDGDIDEVCTTGCTSTLETDAEYVIGATTDELFDVTISGDDATDTVTACTVTVGPGTIDYTIAFRLADPGRYEFSPTGGVARLSYWYHCGVGGSCAASTAGSDGALGGTYTFDTGTRPVGHQVAVRYEGSTLSTFQLRARYLGP